MSISLSRYWLQKASHSISQLGQYGEVITQDMTERSLVARCLKAMEIPYEEDCEAGPLGGSRITLKEVT